MQALTSAATAPSTVASGVFTSCATEKYPKKVAEIALIKPTDGAVDLIFMSLVLLVICVT